MAECVPGEIASTVAKVVSGTIDEIAGLLGHTYGLRQQSVVGNMTH